jgi:hypothetical protein
MITIEIALGYYYPENIGKLCYNILPFSNKYNC